MTQKTTPNKNKAENQATLGLVGADQLAELVQDKRKFFWLNFTAGLWRGVGGILGVVAVLILLGFALKLFGGLPWIGDFIQDINQAANTPASR